jgi:hypothetical protein
VVSHPNYCDMPTTQCNCSTVSKPSLSKTGILVLLGRDFWEFRRQKFDNWESGDSRAHGKPGVGGHFLHQKRNSPNSRMAGWGGRIRTSEWWNQNPLPYHLATPHQIGRNPPGARSIAARALLRNLGRNLGPSVIQATLTGGWLGLD